MSRRLTRRRLLGAVPAVGLGATALHGAIAHSHGDATAATDHAAGAGAAHGAGTGHAAFRGGEVDHRANGFDPPMPSCATSTAGRRAARRTAGRCASGR